MPFGADSAQAAALRAQGYATVPGLAPAADAAAEARRLGCTHVVAGGEARPLLQE